MAIDLGDHAGAVAKVRRHVLRRLLVADVLGLAAAALLGPLLVSRRLQQSGLGGRPDAAPVVLFDLAVIPLFIGVFAIYGLYRGATRRISLSVFSDLRNIVHALMVSGFLYAIVGYVAHRYYGFQDVTVGKILAMCLVAVVTVPLARVVSFGLIGRAPEGSVPVIVVGTGKLAQTVASHLRAHSSVKFVGFVDDSPLGRSDVLGELEDLPELCRRFDVARVVVCFSRTHPERTTEMLKALSGKVGVSIVPRYYELITSRSHVEDLSGLPMIDIAPASLSGRVPLPQAHVRRRRVVGRPGAALAVLPGHGRPHQVDQSGSGLLPPGADRPERAPVLGAQVPHHVRGRRGAQGRDRAPERDGRPALQGHRRPPGHPARSIPPPHQPRRAPPADQRVEGRHVAGRPAPVRGRPRPRRSRAGPASASRPVPG